jgi:hypothetical protein
MLINKMIQITLVSVLGMVLVTATAFGQNIKTELEQMNKKYTECSSYSMNVQVKLINTKTDKITAQYNGKALKSEAQYYAEMMNKVTLITPKSMLIVDHTNKVIVYSPTNGQQFKGQTTASITSNIEQLLAAKKLTVIAEDPTKGTKTIEVKADDPVFEKTHVVINVKKNLLVKLVYFYKNTGDMPYDQLEVMYTDITVNKSVSSKWFSRKQYISGSGKNIKPVAAYKEYRFYDQTKTAIN